MTERFAFTTAALLCATTMAWTQAPQPGDPQGQQQSQMGTRPSVTVVGCLQREADVPGRSPNVAERAGIAEDYILTSAEMKGSGSSQDTAGVSGSAARSRNFKVEGIDDEQLQQHLNKRVEITGTLDRNWEAGASRPGGVDRPGSMRPGAPEPDAGEPGRIGQTEPGQTEPGQIEPGQTGQAGAGVSEDLPQIEATSIREVGGECKSGMY